MNTALSHTALLLSTSFAKCLQERVKERVKAGQSGTSKETKSKSKHACVNLYQSTHSIQLQPERVVSETTIVGNMIFHYTLCKQCKLSVLPVRMIDCGLSREKSDTSGKRKSFSLNKARRIQAATEKQ